MKSPAFAAMWLALAFTGCMREIEECHTDECAQQEYEIATRISEPFDSYGRHIDTLDTGRLHVQVQVRQLPAPAKRSAQVLSCIGCEGFFKDSRLTFDQPILAGNDTLAAGTNLLDPAVVAKVGHGSLDALRFHDHVRFKRGANRIAFASNLVLQDRKLGSVSLERTLFVGERSSW